MNFYVKYWQEGSNSFDFYIQKYLNAFYTTKPNKKSLLAHNNLALTEIENFLSTNPDTDEIYLELTGGELFHTESKALYEGFNDTLQMLQKVKTLTSNSDIDLQIRINSGLIYENLDLIKYVIDKAWEANLEEIKWRTVFNLDDSLTTEQLDLYLGNLHDIAEFLGNRAHAITIKTYITKNTINNFDPDGYTFKLYSELIRIFKFNICRYEIPINIYNDNVKNMYFLSDGDFFTFFDKIQEFLPPLHTKIDSNSDTEKMCLIENETCQILTYNPTKNVISKPIKANT